MNTMEWYFGNEVEDLVVPKGYYEQAQMISSSAASPENWLQWGINGFGSCYPKKNLDSNMNMMIHEQLCNNGGSLLWNDEADFQQFAEEEARINRMDDNDLFFRSLLEEDPTKADITEGKTVNSTTDQMPEYSGNENLMEEPVLNDLERVTAQLTDKTRICLRDAFYRLAESSKQCMMTSNDDTLRAGETGDSEYKTNVIDRAVASLVFHKSDFDDTYSQLQTDYNNDAEFCDLEV
ncbi:protein LNK4-like isoform X2 [Bidens hawaiensis]|uniref:protein LNK4-like isoform X2 n=1 Tax=Bidens hawaiensis TaxID=980011 RepID=UPI0040494E71